jgi:hypothetical protein
MQASHATCATSEPRSGRRSLRRALTIDCRIECESWEGAVFLPATDVSTEGLWIQTSCALSPGDEVVVSFALPNASPDQRVWATAKVARVGMWRRRDDVHAPGMGLMFTYCSDADRQRLAEFLVGRPPPLPPSSMRTAVRAVEASLRAVPPSEEQLLAPVLALPPGDPHELDVDTREL